MQVKTGTDIIEVERIKDSIEKLGDKAEIIDFVPEGLT